MHLENNNHKLWREEEFKPWEMSEAGRRERVRLGKRANAMGHKEMEGVEHTRAMTHIW